MYYRLPFKNINVSIFFMESLLRLSVCVYPALENVRSHGTDVDGTPNLCNIKWYIFGYIRFISFHHTRGSDFLGIKGSLRNLSNFTIASEVSVLTVVTSFT